MLTHGYKSTEFWLLCVVLAVWLCVSFGPLPVGDTDQTQRTLNWITPSLTGLYVLARTLLKLGTLLKEDSK